MGKGEDIGHLHATRYHRQPQRKVGRAHQPHPRLHGKSEIRGGLLFPVSFQSIAKELQGVQELRLLIGNTTNRETLEQLAEGYHRLEQVADVAEAQTYPKRIESQQMGGRNRREHHSVG